MIRTTWAPRPLQPRPADTHHAAPGLERALAAADRAAKVYPEPVGEALKEALTAWASIGYRFGGGAQIGALVAKIEAKEIGT